MLTRELNIQNGSPMFPPVYCVCFSFEVKSHSVDQAGLELMVLLCRPRPRARITSLHPMPQGPCILWLVLLPSYPLAFLEDAPDNLASVISFSVTSFSCALPVVLESHRWSWVGIIAIGWMCPTNELRMVNRVRWELCKDLLWGLSWKNITDDYVGQNLSVRKSLTSDYIGSQPFIWFTLSSHLSFTISLQRG